MRRFILEHSDFSRAQTNVTKHVNIVTQLSELVAARSLMDVSTVRMKSMLDMSCLRSCSKCSTSPR
jgi:vacuolar protein sorting-associated protein 45